MIAKVTDAMVEIEGAPMRGLTWVHEVASENCSLKARTTTVNVKALQANGK